MTERDNDLAGGEDRDGLRAEFFEAVRRIIAAAGRDGAGPGIGGDRRPEEEVLRLVAAQGSRHPDAEIASAERSPDNGRVTLEATFMGLTGPSGVLPDHYTELVVARDRARDAALGEFLDLFNHRALSLFYRAWAKYRLPVAFEDAGGRLDDPFSAALAAIAGRDGPGDDPRLLGAVGLLARRVRSPEAVRRVLTTLFGLPIEVLELQPHRIRIDAGDQTRIPSGDLGRGAYMGLGVDAVAGETAVNVASRFRLRVGPLDAAQFDAFFLDGGTHARLAQAVRAIVGATMDFDIQLVLQKEDVPQIRVSDAAMPTRLGQNSWLLHGPAERNRDDTVLPARRAEAGAASG
ncbi:type VI secretion system baseplate subunit TssG [Sphingomonas jatrophae]|nr:type VI secretion system baseplate subunit TssG [Sphingomonas jatrophae]